MQPLQICIGSTIRNGQESWCLPYAGVVFFFLFFLQKKTFFTFFFTKKCFTKRNSKTQLVIKLKNSKTQIVIKLKNANYDETQKLTF